MQVEYTGRQIAITPSLRRLAEEGLDRVGKVVGRAAVLTSFSLKKNTGKQQKSLCKPDFRRLSVCANRP